MKRGQVWIETVIYTLIAFVMIGTVLSFVKPKIEELQDKAIIEQSIGLMADMNNVILSILQGGAGNKRKIELSIKKGNLKIDGKNNTISLEMESIYTYSQPGEYIQYGETIIHTAKRGKYNIVTLTNNYDGRYNITYFEKDELKLFGKASTPYILFISNNGKSGNETIINIEIN